MVKIFRPDGQSSQGRARISAIDPGLSAIGQALQSAGRRFQTSNAGQAAMSIGARQAAEGARELESLSRIVEAEARRQNEVTERSVRSSRLQDKVTNFTVEYEKALQDRQNARFDDKGNPTYNKLTEDTRIIGEELMMKYVDDIDDPELKVRVVNSLKNSIANKQIGSLRIAKGQQMDHAQAAYIGFRDAKLNEAKAGDFEAINGPLGEIEGALNDRVLAGEITETQKAEEMLRINRDARIFHLQKAIGENPTAAKDMLKQGAGKLGINEEDHLNLSIRADNAVSALNKASEAQSKAIRSQLDFAFKQANEFLDMGKEVPQDLIGLLQHASRGTNFEAEVKGLIQRQKPLGIFSKLNTVERQRTLEKIQSRAILDPEFNKIRDNLNRLNKNIEKQLKEDPVNYIVSQGLIEPKQPLDLNSPLGQQIAARNDISALLKSEYNIDSHGLTAQELNQLSAHLNSLDSDQKLLQIADMTAALGREGSAALFADIKVNGDSMTAFAGMLVSENQNSIAKNIMDGQKLLKDKVMSAPNKILFQQELSKLKLPNYYDIEQKQDVIKAIHNIYVKKSFDAGDFDSEDISTSRLKSALKEATNGRPIVYNGVKIEPPVFGMDEDGFGDWVDSLTEAELLALGGISGISRPIKDVLEDATFQNIGRGVYLVHPGDPGDPAVALTGAGEPFLLDYDYIQNTLRKKSIPQDTMQPHVPTTEKNLEQEFIESLGLDKEVTIEPESVPGTPQTTQQEVPPLSSMQLKPTGFDMENIDILKKVSSSSADESALQVLAAGMDSVLVENGIDTPLRKRHFIAQLAHESAGFRSMVELRSDSSAEAKYGAHTRVGKVLGNTQPGDGARYKGRGFIQLTGRYNYRAVGNAIGIDLENNPDLAAEPEIALLVAIAFWNSRDLNELADANNLKAITKKINGGFNGLADRRRRFQDLGEI